MHCSSLTGNNLSEVAMRGIDEYVALMARAHNAWNTQNGAALACDPSISQDSAFCLGDLRPSAQTIEIDRFRE